MDVRWGGYLLVAGVLAALFWWSGGGLTGGGDATRFLVELPGVYQDEDGARLELWFEDTPSVNTVLGPMVGMDGRFASVDVVSPGETRGGWNFGYHEPLVLNLVLEPGGGRFARVRLESDGLRLRVSEDPEAVVRPGFLQGPEVRVMKRVGLR